MKNEEISKNIVGEKEYMKIHKDLNDSIILWSSLKLETWRNYKIYEDVIIDKIICFNLFKNKFVTASLERNFENPKLDGITYIYGVKIDSNWYFFQGAHIVLPREMYQKEVTKPLSFEKLHEIALKEVFSGYLKKKDKGFLGNIWGVFFPEYEPDEAWFDRHFRGSGWGCGKWLDEDGDGNSEKWIDTCTEKQFNALYYRKYHSVWELPADKSLFNTEIEQWTYITTDSFNKLFAAKIIDSFGNPIGTIYDDKTNRVIRPAKKDKLN